MNPPFSQTAGRRLGTRRIAGEGATRSSGASAAPERGLPRRHRRARRRARQGEPGGLVRAPGSRSLRAPGQRGGRWPNLSDLRDRGGHARPHPGRVRCTTSGAPSIYPASRGRGRRRSGHWPGLELQRRLPNARIVYASATGASEVANLAYAERLGLWGRGTPLPGVKNVVEKVSAGGIAAMELVATDLKAMGFYLARSISYDGVQYRTLTHELSPYQACTYDRLAEAWQVVLRGIENVLGVTKGNKSGARGRLQPVLGRPPAVLPARPRRRERAQSHPRHRAAAGGGEELRCPTRLDHGGRH